MKRDFRDPSTWPECHRRAFVILITIIVLSAWFLVTKELIQIIVDVIGRIPPPG